MENTITSQRPVKTTPLAVASFVFCILGITLMPWLGSIIAIILGKMALSEIHAHPERYDGEGLAKAGVKIGWIGAIGILVLAGLAVIFFAPLRAVGPVMP